MFCLTLRFKKKKEWKKERKRRGSKKSLLDTIPSNTEDKAVLWLVGIQWVRGFIQSHSVPSALFKSLFLGSKAMSSNTSSQTCLVLVHKVSLLLSLASQCIFSVLPNLHSYGQEITAVKMVTRTFRVQWFVLPALAPSHWAVALLSLVRTWQVLSIVHQPKQPKRSESMAVRVTGNRSPFLT